jgi:hypothetical protein
MEYRFAGDKKTYEAWQPSGVFSLFFYLLAIEIKFCWFRLFDVIKQWLYEYCY